MEPLFSVVVPAYNRLDSLPEVLGALERQLDAPPFEVIVVDDGSTDGTGEWLQSEHRGRDVRVLRQENGGPARARNRGVAEARGRWVAFLGDDTVPCAGWLARHHRAQTGELGTSTRDRGLEVGVIGYTRWHRRMHLTPFLRYINEYGLQFGYSLIEDPCDVPFNFFYTSNLSLSRRLLREEPFDQDFPHPAWEDIELSYRLKQRGFRLLYEAEAIVDHDHPTDLDRFSQRQRKAGEAAVVFYRLHPELGAFLGVGPQGPPPLPGRWRQVLLQGLARALQNTPVRWPRLWEAVLRYHYIEGLLHGWANGVGERRREDESDSQNGAGIPLAPGDADSRGAGVAVPSGGGAGAADASLASDAPERGQG